LNGPALLSDEQISVIQFPFEDAIFLQGPAGTGKTTVGVERLLNLLASGIDGREVLVLVPQRTLAFPYYEALDHPDLPPGGLPTIATLGGISRRSIELFWPMIAAQTGFLDPHNQPTFLTLETSQYYMAHLVTPLLEKGYFDSVTIDRNRLFSQIIDNLNKAAAIGIPHTEIAERLKAAWVGEPAQIRIYEEAQECANLFRSFCLERNLLDYSLQMEIFHSILIHEEQFRQYFQRSFRHLLFDNLEEDTPVVHEMVQDLLPDFDSALLIYDTDGGYRSFLGADPQSGLALKQSCHQQIAFLDSFVTTPALDVLGYNLSACLNRQEAEPVAEIREVLEFNYLSYQPQMVQDIATRVATLVKEEDIPPGEIAILAPFLSDALRFSIATSLAKLGIPSRSHRPSRRLQEEPATACLLTLAKLAHPHWQLHPRRHEVRSMLIQAIEGMDLVRADLLSRILFREAHPEGGLGAFEQIQPDMQERITYHFGERYEILRSWLLNYRDQPEAELDVCLSRLFGEVLSQPGFGFHQNFDRASIAARLIESVQKFRRVINQDASLLASPAGMEYIRMVESGIMAAQYLGEWRNDTEDAVLLAPAYTFLMSNRPVSIQFWLEIGSMGWWERLYQPLTHPYVLSRHWDGISAWTDTEERQSNRLSLDRLTKGLIRRCRAKIFLYTTSMDNQGREQRGELLRVVQILMRRLSTLENKDV
jgi:hypothetical protein